MLMPPSCSLEIVGEGRGLMLEWLLLNKPVMSTGLGCLHNVLWYGLSFWCLTESSTGHHPTSHF